MMKFYGLGYQETLNLPLKTFWLMSANINRISAEVDIRQLQVTAAAGSEDGFKSVLSKLQSEMGTVITAAHDIEKDRQGLKELKALYLSLKG